MKKYIVLTILLGMCLSARAQNGRELYNKFSDSPGMEAVYISPAMFRMIGRIPDVELQDGSVNFSSVIKSMTGFYILNTSDAAVGKLLYDDVNQYVRSGRFELLMEAKDKGSVTRMYTVGDERTVTSFVMLAQDNGEVSFISFDGKMDRQELDNLLAASANEN